MSFLLIQLLSAAGVALTIALTWMVGWSKNARIESVSAAAERFRADFPAAAVQGGAVDAEGRAALLDLPDAVGLVVVVGDKMVTRRLISADVRPVDAGGELQLRLRDPTLPRVRLRLADPALWARKLGAA